MAFLDVVLPALISGGSSLLSGLANPKQDNRSHNLAVAKGNMKRLTALNNQEIAWNRAVEAKARNAGSFMMAEAERLGINPITYLNAGGLTHAFNVATVGLSKPAFQTYVRPEEAYTSTGVTTGQAFGGAMEAFGSEFAAGLRQQSQNDFQREMLAMQLVAANARGNGSGYSLGGVPTAALFSGGGSSHMTTAAGDGGLFTLSKKPGEYETPWGKIKVNWNYDQELGKKIFGEIGSPFVEAAMIIPRYFDDKTNRQTAQRLWEDWNPLIGQGAEWAWEEVKKGMQRMDLKRRVEENRRNRLLREQLDRQNKKDQQEMENDPIFNRDFW